MTPRDTPGGSRRRLALVGAALALLGGAAVLSLRRNEPGDPHQFTGATMGTTYSVVVDEDLSRDLAEAIGGLIQERLDRVEGLMSTFDSASEVSRFNRSRSTEPVAVSPELIDVVALALDVSERSGGAFDITVAPLVEAWGFGPGPLTWSAPDPDVVASLRERVGYRRIVVDRTAGTLAKTHPDVTIDLSGIAKGYAAELVASALVARGLRHVLVEVGGELQAVGTRREARSWRVGIERPDADPGDVAGTVPLGDEGIATSGDYRNYFEDDGVRYAHIIDPRTGSPIVVRGASVSVIHASAAAADAWATALTVLGPDAGSEVAAREGLAALFVMRSEGGLRTVATPAMEGRFTPLGENPD